MTLVRQGLDHDIYVAVEITTITEPRGLWETNGRTGLGTIYFGGLDGGPYLRETPKPRTPRQQS